MIRTVLSMVVRPGQEPEFERVWTAAAKQIGMHQGNLSQTLARDARQPRRYVITSDWVSQEALSRFETSTTRTELSAALERLRESADKSVLNVITMIAGSQP